MKKALIQAIRLTLESQRFADWYNGAFTDYVQGEDLDVTEIDKDIAKLFGLENN